MQKQVKVYCQICERWAVYLCGQCQTAAYCTNQHRLQHWRLHKQHCKVLRTYNQLNRQSQIKSNYLLSIFIHYSIDKRSHFRKQYFQVFNNKIYDKALIIARQMFEFQQETIKKSRFIMNQFQYGITICLLCRTLIILNKKSQAKIQIQNYLKEKQHFLQDLRDINKFPDNEAQITQKSKEFLKKKLQLISAVANIYYSLGQPPIHFYTVYLSHIQLAFGPQSPQASNCYFLIGTYYMQNRQFNKAIACFVRTANMRGPKAGDCYYNLAIIYQMRDKPDFAIRFFQYSLKLKQQQGDQNSIQIAKIYQSIAQLQIKGKSFIRAIKSLQQSLKIYSNKNQMLQYDRIKQKIKILQNYIQSSITLQDKSLLPKQIQDQLVDKKNQINPSQLKNDQLSFIDEKQRKQRFNIENIIKFSQQFLSRLNSGEMYRLSELQLQMEKCNSEYALAYTVSNSDFLFKLSQNRLKEMKRENEKLFELINIEKKLSNSVLMK